MKKRFIFCLAILQIALTVSLYANALAADRNPSADSLAARVDSLIAPQIKPGGPGCAIAVIRDGKIIF
jgi:CubicO group peptidase (beta-lactamase class C family)